MEANWNILKEKIQEQLEDIDRHRGCSGSWNMCGKMYREVLKMMTAIENGLQNELKPDNCIWKKQITKNED